MDKLKVPTKFTYFKTNAISNLEMFRKVIQYDNFVASVVGCDIFTKGYTMLSFHCIFCVSNLFILFFLNIFDIFLFADDLSRVFLLLVTLFSGTQIIAGLFTFIVYKEDILDHVARVESYISRFNTESANKIFEKWVLILCHVMSVNTFVFLSAGFLIIVYPVIYYLILGEKILHFGFEIPFVDWQTSAIGYLLNFAWCAFLVISYAFAAISTTFLGAFPIIMSLGQFELIKHFLKELDNVVRSNDKSERDDEIKKRISTIAEMHNELLE